MDGDELRGGNKVISQGPGGLAIRSTLIVPSRALSLQAGFTILVVFMYFSCIQ